MSQQGAPGRLTQRRQRSRSGAARLHGGSDCSDSGGKIASEPFCRHCIWNCEVVRPRIFREAEQSEAGESASGLMMVHYSGQYWALKLPNTGFKADLMCFLLACFHDVLCVLLGGASLQADKLRSS